MRQRNRHYSDYHLTQNRVEKIKSFCVGNTEKSRQIAFKVCEEVNPIIARELYASLTLGLSYDRLSVAYYIPISKPDFIGYQKQCIARISEVLAQD